MTMVGPSLFIFGSERGGTTLLSALLSAHPQVYVLNDSFLYLAFVEAWAEQEQGSVGRGVGGIAWQLRDLLRRVPILRATLVKIRCLVAGGYRPDLPNLLGLPDAGARVQEAMLRAFLARLEMRYRMTQSKGESGDFLRQYRQALQPDIYLAKVAAGDLSLRALLDQVYCDLLSEEQQAKPILGEKTPRHFYCAPWIQHLYPDAKLITLVRNPLANVASLHERMSRDLPGAIAKYRSYHAGPCTDFYGTAHSLVVRYEDLIYETEDCLERIGEYLGLSTEFDGEVGSSSRSGYIGEAIDPDRDRRRMAYFSAAQRQRVLAECRDIIDRHYPDLERYL